MERKKVALEFSRRLNSILKERGFVSKNALSGVTVRKLSDSICCSHQMVRKYTLGEALPDYFTVLKMAEFLKVSPGWLLFGDNASQTNVLDNKELLYIDPEILKYILLSSIPLLEKIKEKNDVMLFILEIVNDAAHLKANQAVIKKMIDLAISSVDRFHSVSSKENNLLKELQCINA